MSQPQDHEARLTALESRVEVVAADAAAARHLAAAHDRDLAQLPIKIDANRQAINALGLQTAGRFDEVHRRFDEVDRRFGEVDRRFDGLETEMRTGFATTAAGMQHIVELLEGDEGAGPPRRT